ncbi:hypothetical protein ACET3X_005325 [Alternaria dauci]|uniref:NACHT domain-containing protein n=1 Tax=Alternaria dauci TaxID=48095 RepID=A0ABR3UJZ0_9PLEO
MGILGVSLSPIDGESQAEAMKRVRDEVEKQNHCVRDLRLSNPRDDKKRIEETKGGLLTDAYRWVLENHTFQQWQQDLDSRLLWVKGDPGKGKTMLLCGLINELQSSIPQSALLSYFFCQATDTRINSATAVLRGLLYMLVTLQPSLASHIRKKHDYAGKTMFEDENAWIVLAEIFEAVLQDPSLRMTYLIIDALDECVTDRPKLLSFIALQLSASPRAKWVVSSRNWPDIEAQLDQAGHKLKLSLELTATSVAAAVSVFIQNKVYHLAQEKRYKPEIQDAVLQHLTSNANDTFLWVALVCQDLQATAKHNVLKKLHSFPPGLDALYERMMQQINKSDDAELCKQVLASIALVHRPVTLEELVALIEQLEDIADDQDSIREIVALCGSFLTLQDDIVYFVHHSAQEFFLARSAGAVFPSGTEVVDHAMVLRSLQVISKTLHQDVYGLKEFENSADKVEQPIRDPSATEGIYKEDDYMSTALMPLDRAAKADVLSILDCCFASSAVMKGKKEASRTLQLLATCLLEDRKERA